MDFDEALLGPDHVIAHGGRPIAAANERPRAANHVDAVRARVLDDGRVEILDAAGQVLTTTAWAFDLPTRRRIERMQRLGDLDVTIETEGDG